MSEEKYLKKGQKLSLRFMEERDFPLIVKWRNLERIRQNFIYREEFTLEGQRNWQKTMIDTGKVVQFMICENAADHRPVGSVYFRDIDHETDSAEYGIFIGEDDALGKGYGNEAATLAVEYARDVMKLKKLILRVFIWNISAIRSYEHAGFRKSKDVAAVTCSDGTKGDMILMDLEL
ncbi:GNAT family N-acetyltransferase [Butyrivibrio sp. AE2032]|uniref:GNAT family N-acetyltransferase n=1 Tax=Butyrivibrio sp. AE2032 TaxID=1458463 RepID=UPI0006910D5C|nr:GNAT family N-acetyltransferase [Butyrivibrio sp. AE2032]